MLKTSHYFVRFFYLMQFVFIIFEWNKEALIKLLKFKLKSSFLKLQESN
jgi:hypothetical protein